MSWLLSEKEQGGKQHLVLCISPDFNKQLSCVELTAERVR